MNEKTQNIPEETAVSFDNLRRVVGIAAMAMVVLVFLFAGWNVWDLFTTHLKAGPLEAGLAVVASVAVCAVVLAVILTTRHASLRGMGAIWLIAWAILVLALVGLNSALRGGFLAVPEALSGLGQVFAALLAGLAILPAITLPLAASERDVHSSAATAAAAYVGFVAKGVGIAASVFASAFFGLSRGMDPMLAVLCGLLLETCFLWAYLALLKARSVGDIFDVWTWGVAVLLFGGFIALVSVETVSTLGRIEVPLVKVLGDVGASLYVSAVGLSLILTITVHVITAAVDMRPKGKMVGKEKPMAIVRMSPMALAQDVEDVPTLEEPPAEADTMTKGQDADRAEVLPVTGRGFACGKFTTSKVGQDADRAEVLPVPPKSKPTKGHSLRRSTEVLEEW